MVIILSETDISNWTLSFPKDDNLWEMFTIGFCQGKNREADFVKDPVFLGISQCSIDAGNAFL